MIFSKFFALGLFVATVSAMSMPYFPEKDGTEMESKGGEKGISDFLRFKKVLPLESTESP